MTNVPSVHAASKIECLVQSWRPRFLSLAADAARRKPSPDRWSIAEVVGHLVDSACNNHQRFVRAQHCENLVFPKYEQSEWVTVACYQQSNWNSLVELWYHYNRQIAVLVRNIPAEKLSTPCTITPYDECTLGFLVTDYADHLEHHCSILAERISSQNNA